MEKKDIFNQIEQVEEQMGNAYSNLTALKEQIIRLLEENKMLTIENQQLRKLLKKETQPEEEPVIAAAAAKETSALGEGRDNLARLYHEGFHICNVYYGHLRTEGDCLFCMSFFHK